MFKAFFLENLFKPAINYLNKNNSLNYIHKLNLMQWRYLVSLYSGVFVYELAVFDHEIRN